MTLIAAILAAFSIVSEKNEYQPAEFFSVTNALDYARKNYADPMKIVGNPRLYVQEKTNAWTWGEFAVYRNGEETNLAPPHVEGDDAGRLVAWDVSGCILESGQDVEARPGRIVCGANCWQIGPWHSVSNGVKLAKYEAERPYTITRENAGKWIHRGMVADEAAQAALLSTFGGYYERIYYASQGQSNVWDTAVYGPTRRFDFQSRLWDYQPTNRTVVTRRLVESENILALRDELERVIPCFCSTDGRSFAPRTGWIVPDANADRYMTWWGSSAIGTYVSPDPFGWTDRLFDACKPERWTASASCLGHWKRNDSDVGRAPHVWKPVLDRVIFDGDPCRTRLDDIGYALKTNYTGIVSTVFKPASGKFAKEKTKRLFTEDLALANQTLALMDRTVHVQEIGPYTNGLKRTYVDKYLERTARRRVSVTTSDQDGVLLLAEPFKASDLRFSTVTNYTSMMTEDIAGRDDVEQLRISATVTDMDLASHVYGTEASIFADVGITSLADGYIAQGEVSYSVSVVYHGFSGNAVQYAIMLQSDSAPDLRFGGIYSIAIDTNALDVVFAETCKRSYSYAAKALRPLSVGVSQPGADAKPSMIDGNAATNAVFFGILELRGNGVPDTLNRMRYTQGYGKTYYKLAHYPYLTRPELVASIQEAVTDLRETMHAHAEAYCGADPEAPDEYIPVRAGIFADMEENTTFDRAYLSIRSRYANVHVRGRNGGPWRIVTVDENGVEHDVFGAEIAVVSVTLGGCEDYGRRPSGFEDHPSFAADGHFESVTQVNWKWRSLRLINEE